MGLTSPSHEIPFVIHDIYAFLCFFSSSFHLQKTRTRINSSASSRSPATETNFLSYSHATTDSDAGNPCFPCMPDCSVGQRFSRDWTACYQISVSVVRWGWLTIIVHEVTCGKRRGNRPYTWTYLAIFQDQSTTLTYYLLLRWPQLSVC